jgi:hypothetical protein
MDGWDMKTTKELIDELSKYPPDAKWYAIIDEDEGGMLVSGYDQRIPGWQGAINCDEDDG